MKAAYTSVQSIPNRLGRLQTYLLPELDKKLDLLKEQWKTNPTNENFQSRLAGLRTQFDNIVSTVAKSLSLHSLFVSINDVLGTAERETELQPLVAELRAFSKQLTKGKDYSTLGSEIEGLSQSVLNALQALQNSKSDETRDGAIATAKSSLQALTEWIAKQDMNLLSNDSSPLLSKILLLRQEFYLTVFEAENTMVFEMLDTLEPGEIDNWHTVFFKKSRPERADADKASIARTAPSCHVQEVGSSTDGSDYILMYTFPVHPDQCTMALRRADAAFFSGSPEDLQKAFSDYQTLIERLQFIPLLLQPTEQLYGQPASGESSAVTALRDRHATLAKEISKSDHGILQAILSAASSHAEQLKSDWDLFGLPANWAPPLSYSFYSKYAADQIDKLNTYEKEYWNFFDTFQQQSSAMIADESIRVADTLRIDDAQHRIESSLARMKKIEETLESEKPSVTAKAQDLKDALEEARKKISKWHWPSAGTIVQTISSYFTAGAMFATGNIGGGAAALGSTIAGGLAAHDEAKNTIENDFGVRVNKKYLLREIRRCDENLESLLKSNPYQKEADGTLLADVDSDVKIATTEAKITEFVDQFSEELESDQSSELKYSLKQYLAAIKERNANIVTYNGLVLETYALSVQRKLAENQLKEVSSELVKVDRDLPLIVGFLRRLRTDMRMNILRTIKHATLALRFWGLKGAPKFSTPPLFLATAELSVHMDALAKAFQDSKSRLSSFPSFRFPGGASDTGIFYRLRVEELDALKIAVTDPFAINLIPTMGGSMDKSPNGTFANGTLDVRPLGGDRTSLNQMYTTSIDGLMQPATIRSGHENAFAGMANVRITQVRFWAPGISVKPAGTSQRFDTDIIQIEITQEGREAIADPGPPGDLVYEFRHHPLYLLSKYNCMAVKTREDIKKAPRYFSDIIIADGTGRAQNAESYAPAGPFAPWRVTIREKNNGGEIVWKEVSEAWLEFEGSGISFEI